MYPGEVRARAGTADGSRAADREMYAEKREYYIRHPERRYR